MTTSSTDDDVLLRVRNLCVHFPVRRGGIWRKRNWLKAVDDISFEVLRGSTLGIVGESGSGKTTAALAVARLIEPTSGRVTLSGQDLSALDDAAMRDCRADMQFIFQDPYSSLNPRLRAEDIICEPLRNQAPARRRQAVDVVDSLLQAVGLHPEQKFLFPHQFSGGQRQRIGIARALVTSPSLIICDEPVSALDVAVQAQILNLLRRLQSERNLTFLFISHDLGVIQYMCDNVIVMYMGKIVERASRKNLFEDPQHPYTKVLLAAVPTVDPSRRLRLRKSLIPGDPPDPADMMKGCGFANRCPLASPICRAEEPPLLGMRTDHQVACHAVNAANESAAG